MPSWPASLPVPVADGYGIEPQFAGERTDVDKGPARVRQTTTRPVSNISVQWLFDAIEMETFEAWFAFFAKYGTVAFDCPMINGRGIKTWSVRFVGTPGEKVYSAEYLNGGNWRVSAKLEVEAPPMLSEASLASRL